MLEGLLYFSLGYVFARILQPQMKADVLLYWNKDCMAWRPVANCAEVKADVRYLAAFEVEPEHLLKEMPTE